MASLNDFRVPLTAFLVVFLSFLCAFPHELFLLFQAFLFKLLDRLLSGLAFLLCASAVIAAFSIINSRQKYMVESESERHFAPCGEGDETEEFDRNLVMERQYIMDVRKEAGQGFVEKAADLSFSMEIVSLPSEVSEAMAEKETITPSSECESGKYTMALEPEDEEHIIDESHHQTAASLFERNGEYIFENSDWNARFFARDEDKYAVKKSHQNAQLFEMDADELYAIKDSHWNAPLFENESYRTEDSRQNPPLSDKNDVSCATKNVHQETPLFEKDEDEFNAIKNSHCSAPWFETELESMKKESNKNASGFQGHNHELNGMIMDEEALDEALVHEINKHGVHAAEMRGMMMALMSPRELSRQADAFITKFKEQMRMQQMQSWKFTSNILTCSSALNMKLEHGLL